MSVSELVRVAWTAAGPRMRPTESEAERLFYSASHLAAAGRHSEAAAEYSRSLALNPASWVATENRGIALSGAGQLDAAATAFEQTIQLVPGRAEAYSLLARVLYEGGRPGGAAAFAKALSLAPTSPALHYEVARTDQLFGRGDAAPAFFLSSQRLAYAAWQREMRCGDSSWSGGPTRWTQGMGGAVRSVRAYAAKDGDASGTYGRTAPRPFSTREWPMNARLRWPSLRFAERGIYVAELHDVWVSGNDGVVSDGACQLYLPSHGAQIPLHLNLPGETVSERAQDASIRRIGLYGSAGGGTSASSGEKGGGGGEGGEGEEVVICLAQLFANGNFYSFFADALARLVVALDALPPNQKLRVLVPADRGKLKPWMWSLLERVGVSKVNSFPYSIRPYAAAATGSGARHASARVHAARLLVVDWDAPPKSQAAGGSTEPLSPSASLLADPGKDNGAALPPHDVDYAHLPPRAALRLLRARLAFPGAHIAFAAPRRTVTYLQRAAAKSRKLANEAALLTAISSATGAADAEVRLLSDAPAMPLADAARLLARSVAIIGVHGAGWANLVFVGDGAHVIEMALPEPHAIYTAHLAYALGLQYHLLPLRQRALHSARWISAPVSRVAVALKRALHEASGPAVSACEAATSVELVVARYNEDPSWAIAGAQTDGWNVTIYNKGAAWRRENRSSGGGSVRWRALPNLGREAHTLLSHIEANYDALADWTVFMQGDPFDHIPDGLNIADYLDAATTGRHSFFPLTAVAQSSLNGLALRSGYAPFPPFSGELVGPPGGWAATNRDRLPALLQPLGLWSAEGEDAPASNALSPFINTSAVAVPYLRAHAGLRMLATRLHWIDTRQLEQRDMGLAHFWRKYRIGGDAPVPSRLYHAQGAQFGVSAAAIRRHPRSFYRALLDELIHRDPVASYYLEMCWWYIFDAEAAVAVAW